MTINPHHSRPTSYSMQQQSIHDLSITSTDWSLPLRRCCNKRWWWRETRSRWNGNTLAKPVNNNIFRRTLHPAALNIKQLTDLTTWAHVDPRMALCDKNAVFPRLLRSPRVVVVVVFCNIYLYRLLRFRQNFRLLWSFFCCLGVLLIHWPTFISHSQVWLPSWVVYIKRPAERWWIRCLLAFNLTFFSSPFMTYAMECNAFPRTFPHIESAITDNSWNGLLSLQIIKYLNVLPFRSSGAFNNYKVQSCGKDTKWVW